MQNTLGSHGAAIVGILWNLPLVGCVRPSRQLGMFGNLTGPWSECNIPDQGGDSWQ